MDKCPTCDSPNPKMHPAMQHEGEVQPCRDPWHRPDDELLAIMKICGIPVVIGEKSRG